MPPASAELRHYIDGAWVRPRGRAERVLVDPATEEPDGAFLPATEEEIAAAAGAARRAFDGGWREAGREQRRAALAALLDAVERRRDAFAGTISREIGAPVDFAREHQVARAILHLRDTLDAMSAHEDDVPLGGDPAHRARYEPVGVAALITPWNWPLNQVALKAGAALAAGCAMVLKPSELTPRSAVLFAEAMAEALEAADAPPGVCNLILGAGAEGAALARRPEVDIVSFTGSTAAGRRVAEAAAGGLKRALLELGGKSPNLLFADCDLETALRQGVAHCFRNAGQSCNAASRMLVERSIYDRAVALAVDAAAKTDAGPQVSQAQFARVQRLIESGIEEGARLVAGGPGRPPGLARGYHSRPTVFADVAPQMQIFRAEIFGPVLTMTPFESEAEAIALANDTPYGLAAYIQTGDPVRADRVARRLRVGMVQVNGVSRAPGAPFGGVKASGYGREAGIWGIRAFQDVKSISGAALRAP